MIHLRGEDLEVLSHCLITGQNSIIVPSCCGLSSYFSFVMHCSFCGLANSSSSETQGQSVGSEEKAGRTFSCTGERDPGYRLPPNYFQKFKQMPALDWAQKMLCIIVPNRRTVSLEFFSWVRTRRLLSRHTCPVRSPSLCVQGNLYFLLS